MNPICIPEAVFGLLLCFVGHNLSETDPLSRCWSLPVHWLPHFPLPAKQALQELPRVAAGAALINRHEEIRSHRATQSCSPFTDPQGLRRVLLQVQGLRAWPDPRPSPAVGQMGSGWGLTQIREWGAEDGEDGDAGGVHRPTPHEEGECYAL